MNAPIAPIDVAGTALGATILTIVVTPIASLLVLWRFRRAVARSMHATAPTASQQAAHSSVPPGPRQPEPGPWHVDRPPAQARARPALSGSLSALALPRLRRVVGWYLAAGVAYALTATVALLTVDGQELLPLRTATVAVVFAWPLVPTLALVCAWSWRRTTLTVIVYLGGVLALGTLSLGGVLGPLFLWALFMLPSSLIVAGVAGRPLRAVGPFIAPSVFVVGVGYMIWPWIALPIASAGASLNVAVLVTVALVGLSAAVVLLSVPIAAWRHRRKAASEQSVVVDQWWLLFALDQCLLSAGRGWLAPAMLLPYVAYLIVVRIGRRRAYRQVVGQQPARLLLLRVFGARGRSERLLRQVSAYWPYVGSVELIAGTDLASETLEPREFLDFILGTLSRQFVTDSADLRRRIDQLDLRPDGDGRYRITEFFCHVDTWQQTLLALAHGTDVILVDLRELTPQNQGVAYELDQLARLRLLNQVVALVDRTTDRPFLRHVLSSAGAPPRLRTVEVDGRRTGDGRLLSNLDAARAGAGTGPG